MPLENMKILFGIFIAISIISLILCFYNFILIAIQKVFSIFTKMKKEWRDGKISVILPTAGLKKENLNSFLCQIFDFPYEIIFINEGSENNYIEDLLDRSMEFSNVLFKLVSHNPEPYTVNLSSTKVEGLRNAKGNLFLLADAKANPDSKHLSEIFKQMKYEKIGAIICPPEYNIEDGFKEKILRNFFESTFWSPLTVSAVTFFNWVGEGLVCVKKNYIREIMNDRFIKNYIPVEGEFVREVKRSGGRVEFIKKVIPIEVNLENEGGLVEFLNFHIVTILKSYPPFSYIPLFITLGFPLSVISLIIAIFMKISLLFPLILISGSFLTKFILNIYTRSIYKKNRSIITNIAFSFLHDFLLSFLSIKSLLNPVIKKEGKKYLIQKKGIGVPLNR